MGSVIRGADFSNNYETLRTLHVAAVLSKPSISSQKKIYTNWEKVFEKFVLKVNLMRILLYTKQNNMFVSYKTIFKLKFVLKYNFSNTFSQLV